MERLFLSSITNNNVDESEPGSPRDISEQQIRTAKTSLEEMLKKKNATSKERPEQREIDLSKIR